MECQGQVCRGGDIDFNQVSTMRIKNIRLQCWIGVTYIPTLLEERGRHTHYGAEETSGTGCGEAVHGRRFGENYIDQ